MDAHDNFFKPFLKVSDEMYTDKRETIIYFEQLLQARNNLFDAKLSRMEAHEEFMRKLFLR